MDKALEAQTGTDTLSDRLETILEERNYNDESELREQTRAAPRN